MNRVIALALLALGVALLLCGIFKIIPGVAFAAGWLIVLGILSVGLSFIPSHQVPQGAPLPPAPAGEIAASFYAPGKTFRNLSANPRWLGAFLVAALSLGLFSFFFVYRVSPEVIETARAHKIIASGWIPAANQAEFIKAQVEAAASPFYIVSPVVIGTVYLFLSLLSTALVCLFGVAMVGGRINFWQAFSVAAYALLPVVVIRSLLNVLILFLRSPDELDPLHDQYGLVTDNLGAFFSPVQHPLLFTAGTFIGLLWLYRVWLLSVGLRNAGEKELNPAAAWSVAISVWAVGLVAWSAIAFLMPTIIS
jgi:hypothetical protein